MDIKPLPDDRREDRYQIVLSGRCSNSRQQRATARITNLSTHGCKIETGPISLEKDATVWIKLGSRDPLQGEVRWHKADSAGVRWENPLHPAILDHIYAEHDASKDTPPLGPAPIQIERRNQLRLVKWV